MQHAVFEEWNNEGDAILLRDISSYSIDFRNTSSMGLFSHKNIHESSCKPLAWHQIQIWKGLTFPCPRSTHNTPQRTSMNRPRHIRKNLLF